MPIRLGAERNELILADNLSGQQVALYYRHPTTAERVAYTNGCLVREGKRLVNRTAEARATYGRAILVGIRDGDFEREDGAGGWRPLSTSDEDWKACLCAYAGHLVDTLAFMVFEAACRAETTSQSAVPAIEEGEPDPNA